jgi:DNA-binding CsgD family transcriptional regulator
VASQMTIRTRDLKRLCAVVDKAHLAASDEAIPHSLLLALHDLVPCDEISYQVIAPARKEFLYGQDLVGTPCVLEANRDRFEEFFWPAYWSSLVCSYPQQTDDKTGVRRATDFLSASEFRGSPVGELFRLQDSRFNIMVPLAIEGDVDYRIELWRSEGPDFSDREQMLLTLLRPHLAELELAQRRRRANPLLTPRQTELLQLVANGLTNRQVATRLSLSEGTVRRHLENIYQRLGVASRTAAAAHVAGH